LNGLRGGGGWILIVRAEVAYEAAFFLCGASVVEGDEAGEQRGGDHRSPRVVFTGAIHSRRPVTAATVLPPIRF